MNFTYKIHRLGLHYSIYGVEIGDLMLGLIEIES